MTMTAFNPTLTIADLADVIKTKGWCDQADRDQLLDLIVLALTDDDAEETELRILALSTDTDPEEVEQFLLGEYSGFEAQDPEDIPYGC